jgi:hypothetical protein
MRGVCSWVLVGELLLGGSLGGSLLGGCKEEAKPGGAASAASAQKSAEAPKPKRTAPTGPAPEVEVKGDDVKGAEQACADYVKALEACIEKAPADAKEGFREQLKAHNESMKDLSDAQKAQQASGCLTGLATLKDDPTCK